MIFTTESFADLYVRAGYRLNGVVDAALREAMWFDLFQEHRYTYMFVVKDDSVLMHPELREIARREKEIVEEVRITVLDDALEMV
jgi:hypothetical protein